MSLGIAGMGWITPLGAGADLVWDRLRRGDEAHAEKIAGQCNGQSYTVFRVPESALASLAPHPRLRRVSLISRFAAAAGLEALANARVKLDLICWSNSSLQTRRHPERSRTSGGERDLAPAG